METVCWISLIFLHRRHAGHAAFLADVGGHALERHDRGRPGVLGDLRLLGVGDVHDDAALEHLGEAHLEPERSHFHGSFLSCDCCVRHALSQLSAPASEPRSLQLPLPTSGRRISAHPPQDREGRGVPDWPSTAPAGPRSTPSKRAPSLRIAFARAHVARVRLQAHPVHAPGVEGVGEHQELRLGVERRALGAGGQPRPADLHHVGTLGAPLVADCPEATASTRCCRTGCCRPPARSRARRWRRAWRGRRPDLGAPPPRTAPSPPTVAGTVVKA